MRGEIIARESKRRDVELLLRDWHTWEAAHGAAISPDESHLRSVNYGPAGYSESGREFDEKDRKRLRESFKALKNALTILKAAEPNLYVVLRRPYLMDGADSSLVGEWRKKAERGVKDAKATVEEHDLAVRMLCLLLHRTKLYAVPAKMMSEREHGKMEHQNAEIYAVYQRMRASGMKHPAAVEQAGESLGVPTDAVERIIEFRDDLKTATCLAEGCDRTPYSQNLCQKHYMKLWREKGKAC